MITEAYITKQFPEWKDWAKSHPEHTANDGLKDDQAVLSDLQEDAIVQLLEYITVTSETISEQIRRHLLNLLKYRFFGLRHGDSEFQHKPKIVRDYEASIEMLEGYRDGKFLKPAPEIGDRRGDIKMESKKRQFNRWFR